ncbi:MAG TPA: carbamoyltransferase HypF [Devosiaceae bacterium]
MSDSGSATEARHIVVGGRVQGVGFRPFVHRLANRMGLSGEVRNTSGRVEIDVAGTKAALEAFMGALIEEAPPLARPALLASGAIPFGGWQVFRIVESWNAGDIDAHLPPDLFCCPDCLAEIADPAARRYRYAFTNCTQCGPRYTIVSGLPYDRAATSMAGFDMCPACRAEYEDPGDRRFHAQPLACPDCGPRLSFWALGAERSTGEAALDAALALIRAGEIVAVKGVGGFHLMCDACNDAAVTRLRARKHRPDKPLAVMFGQAGEDGLEDVRRFASPSGIEARMLVSPERPIVLVRTRNGTPIGGDVAPGLAEIGAFLPYSPLHHLILDALGGPLVATSGNISGEPVITSEAEALERLAGVADGFLVHDRPILRPADDSVMREIAGAPRLLRAGRGIAPVEMGLPGELDRPVLAVGGHMKAAVALGWGRRALVSPHIGELDSTRGRAVFEQVIVDLQHLYGVKAERIACDLHPGYASSKWAHDRGLPLVPVQHHVAHASALDGEHRDVKDWLVFAWDGVGLGPDGTLWGGEAFHGAAGRWRRVASFRPFSVTGGDLVGRQPWRSAAALCWETGAEFLPQIEGADLVRAARERGANTMATSSAGRLFDAAAALVLGHHLSSFEGQGPMLLEAAARGNADAIEMPVSPDADGVLRADWSGLVDALGDETRTAGERAAMFHESMAAVLVAKVLRLCGTYSFAAVGLTGGVFQNRVLCERVTSLLGQEGIECRLPQNLPANDGGLAFGQIIEALYCQPTFD